MRSDWIVQWQWEKEEKKREGLGLKEESMADILNLGAPQSLGTRKHSCRSHSHFIKHDSISQSWSSLQHNLKCRGRFLCLFSDNRKEVFLSISLSRRFLIPFLHLCISISTLLLFALPYPCVWEWVLTTLAEFSFW